MRGAIGTRLFDIPQTPPRVGRFSVLEPVGSGGMGVVYAAYDPQLDRRIALKVLRFGKADASSRAAARLLREAQTLAKLSHPNVVVVYEAGVHDGHVYIAMEFVIGGTLASWCERNPAGAPERFAKLLDLFVQAARGLSAAHDAGLVHRDLKPANLLVDADDRLRVADFGLARAAEIDTETTESSLPAPDDSSGSLAAHADGHTQSDAIAGTPAYMPPEQLDGRSDARSDQWALCATFWEAAYGERPFHADSFAASVAARIEGRLSAPSVRADVPAWFRTVLSRGLAPEPAERFTDMRALLAEIDRGRAPRRGRAFAALGIAVVAASTAAAAAWPPPDDASLSPCRAAEHGLDALWDAEQAAQLVAGLPGKGDTQGSGIAARIDAFAQRWKTGAEAACEEVRARGELDAELADILEIPSRAMECYRDARVELEVVLDAVREAGSPGQAAMLVQAVPDLRRCEDEGGGPAWDMGASRDAAQALARASAAGNLKDFAAARGWLDEARTAMEGRSLPNLESRAFLVETKLHYARDDYESAMASARRALTAAEAGDEPADVVRAWMHMADAARSTERFDEAQFYLDRADSLARRAGDPIWLRARITRAQAHLLALRGDPAAAHRTYQLAREQLVEAFGADSLAAIEILRDASRSAQFAGEHAAAMSLLQEAIDGYSRLMGPSYIETIRAKSSLAALLSDAGDHARALALFEEASAVARTSEDLGPRDRVTALATHAQALGGRRRFAEAQAVMSEASALARSLLKPDDSLLGVIASVEGSFALDAGDYAAAIAIYEPLRVAAPGPDPISRRENAIAICVNLATAYAKSGMAERAGAVVQDCEAILAGIDVHDPARHGAAYRYVADVHAILGRFRAARAAYERALALLEPEEVTAVEVAEAQLGFAALLLASGDREAAAEYVERASRGAAAGTDDLRARIDALGAKLASR